jgi:hypothetical protein
LATNDILPEGEDLRKAVRWVSGELQEHPEETVSVFVNKAVFKFDLSPKDARFLTDFFHEWKKEG